MKKTNKNSSGTSFHHHVIETTVDKLTNLLGEPSWNSNTGVGKVNVEWDCELSDGSVFTIYNWKEYRPISNTENIRFHIGGYNSTVTFKAMVELKDLLEEEGDEICEHSFVNVNNDGKEQCRICGTFKVDDEDYLSSLLYGVDNKQ